MIRNLTSLRTTGIQSIHCKTLWLVTVILFLIMGDIVNTVMSASAQIPNAYYVIGHADVNGDGKSDIVMQYDESGNRYWQVLLSTGSAFVNGGTWSWTSTPGVNVVGLADLNGDGKADLVRQFDQNGTRHWEGLISTGTSFVENGVWSWTSTPGVTPIGLADLNGDGKADLIRFFEQYSMRSWEGLISTGTAFLGNGTWYSFQLPVRDLRWRWGHELEGVIRNNTTNTFRKSEECTQFMYDSIYDRVYFSITVTWRQKAFGFTIWSIRATLQGWVDLRNPTTQTFDGPEGTFGFFNSNYDAKTAVKNFFQHNADAIRQ